MLIHTNLLAHKHLFPCISIHLLACEGIFFLWKIGKVKSLGLENDSNSGRLNKMWENICLKASLGLGLISYSSEERARSWLLHSRKCVSPRLCLWLDTHKIWNLIIKGIIPLFFHTNHQYLVFQHILEFLEIRGRCLIPHDLTSLGKEHWK